jgi:hypothetical protein
MKFAVVIMALVAGQPEVYTVPAPPYVKTVAQCVEFELDLVDHYGATQSHFEVIESRCEVHHD